MRFAYGTDKENLANLVIAGSLDLGAIPVQLRGEVDGLVKSKLAEVAEAEAAKEPPKPKPKKGKSSGKVSKTAAKK